MPAIKATSRLSPHLHFGEISPRQIIWQTLAMSSSGGEQIGEATFLKEVGWREFAYYMLYHFPHTLTKPMNPQFEKFPWSKLDKNHLTAWQKGLTGVPIIDAGMRELWATGWMHNRVRMIVASYLTKNLLIHWREGEHWFRDTLVDADIASNVFGWQWTAGSGADAAPYFRIFNPVLQGEKFDKQGEYVRHWVAELKNCPDKFIHKPWEAPEDIRNQLDYPQPIVDLKATRERALDSYKQIKK
jgi:deoxyribodipyrimidine photo-lyase